MVPAVSKVTPLKVATPLFRVAVIIVVLVFEKVVCGEPEAMPSRSESVELLTWFPNESKPVTVTVKPLPAVCGELMGLMASVATVVLALTVKVFELTVPSPLEAAVSE